MKKHFLICALIILPLSCLLTACGDDDNDGNVSETNVIIRDDGTTSNGSLFSAIDDKNFYLDYVKYTVAEGHLIVSGYDTRGFHGEAKIVSRVSYKGNSYEVLEIGNSAFSGCTSLTSINIPQSVTAIGWNAFSGCTALATIIIPKGVSSIGSGAFSDCKSLASITIPDIVTKIEVYTFSGCTSLASIIIPDNVTVVIGGAFRGCTNLTSIVCKPATPPITTISDLGDLCFADETYKKATLYVPQGSMAAYKSARDWKNFSNIVEK